MTVDAKLQCRLCGEARALRRSHIVPEFAYTGLYTERHSFFVVDSGNLDKIGIRHKGHWERLLCDQCESQFQGYEDYTKRVVYGPNKENSISHWTAVPGSTRDLRYISGVDHRLVKLFGLSVIWRCSVASHHWFSNLDLKRYEGSVKACLQRETLPAKNRFNLFIFQLVSEHGETEVESMLQPYSAFTKGHCQASLNMGGLWWMFCFAHPQFRAPDLVRWKSNFRENGELRISDLPFRKVMNRVYRHLPLEIA